MLNKVALIRHLSSYRRQALDCSMFHTEPSQVGSILHVGDYSLRYAKQTQGLSMAPYCWDQAWWTTEVFSIKTYPRIINPPSRPWSTAWLVVHTLFGENPTVVGIRKLNIWASIQHQIWDLDKKYSLLLQLNTGIGSNSNMLIPID